MAKTSHNPAGRPVSEELTARLHEALMSELETKQFGEITLEGIARTAEVSRPTLYRRYASIIELGLAALDTQSKAALRMSYTTDLPRDLAKYLSGVATVLQSDAPLSRALRGVLAGALVNAKQREPFATLIEKRREPVLTRLKVAWPGRKDREIEHMADLLFGPILYRVLIRQVQVDARLAKILVTEALESKQG